MSREAMKQALETLEQIADEMFSPYGDPQISNAILALRAALDTPEMTAFVWYHPVSGRFRFDGDKLPASWIPLYK